MKGSAGWLAGCYRIPLRCSIVQLVPFRCRPSPVDADAAPRAIDFPARRRCSLPSLARQRRLSLSMIYSFFFFFILSRWQRQRHGATRSVTSHRRKRGRRSVGRTTHVLAFTS